MNSHEKLLRSFFASLDRSDAPGMCKCYQRGVFFSNPIYHSLKSWEAAAMWHMLCENATEINVDVSEIRADHDGGVAKWEIRYVYGDSGKVVDCSVTSRFKFFQGKIVRQADDFDLWRWIRMALGIKGALLGWSPGFQKKLRKTARRRLKQYVHDKIDK